MPGVVPTIYSPRFQSVKLDLAERFGAAMVAVAALMVLGIAAWLKPSPNGISTHLGLGMPKCSLQDQIGIPCPTCGMTTSFAHFARGNLAASFYVQPMGCVLAILTVAIFWVALYIAITGRPAHRAFGILMTRSWLLPFLFFGLAAWGWKILIQLKGMDGWG